MVSVLLSVLNAYPCQSRADICRKGRENRQNYRGEGEYDERRILQGIYR